MGSLALRAPRRALALILAVFLGVIATAAPASAVSEMWKYQARGEVVYGSSYSFDGCESRFVYLAADKRLVSYYASTYNGCTYESSYVEGSGTPSVFKVGGNLSSARLVATVDLVDYSTGARSTLAIDDTWTATERAVTYRSSYSQSLPGEFRITYRYSGAQAPASVEGTVPLDNGFIGKFTQFESSVVR